MVDKKLKVVWLCYFTNQGIQNKLSTLKHVDEFAPWISNSLPLFENDDSIELHIVSQHKWIRGYKTFEKRGITYHFFNAGIPCIGRHWPGFFRFDVLSNFLATRNHTQRIVNKIQPDIIHLRGAENEFSISVIQFAGKYPVLVTIQGFINKSSVETLVIQRRKQNDFRAG